MPPESVRRNSGHVIPPRFGDADDRMSAELRTFFDGCSNDGIAYADRT
jgi:hypothetical protein